MVRGRWRPARWVVSHLFAVAGFLLLVPALTGLLRETEGRRFAVAAVASSRLGVGLVLPYYGAETFGLRVIAQRAVRDGDPALLELAENVRYGSVQASMFLAGRVLLAVGTILAAVAIWRSGWTPRWAGVPLAAGFALFLPQFYGAPWLRIGHGLLIAAGCLLLAVLRWRHRPVASRPQGSTLIVSQAMAS
ncbi:hypothetical protein BH20ACT5_BH20ACT5_02980 [soil metagenome]